MPQNTDLALIMKGGGIKGLAYVGALEELSQFYNFNWYVGTSAGAISAILLASGYTHEELNTILLEKDFKDFKDAGFFKKIFNFFTKSGLYEANSFNNWLDTLLAKKLDSPTSVNLEDLPERVTIYASRRGEEALIFDSTDPAKMGMSASYAARCSMSIPFIFTPQSSEGLKVFDGGAQNNYPVNMLLQVNPGANFIGLYLGSEHFEGNKKKSVFGELITIWTEASDVNALRQHADKTVIIDPRPISTLKFSLTDEEKEFLLECGRLGALKFLNKNEKIQLNPQEFKIRIEKHEEKRTKLQLKVNQKKRRKKFILWTLLFLIVLTGYLKKDILFPPKPDYFTAKVELKNVNNEALNVANGILILDIDGTSWRSDINSKGVAIIDRIPIDKVGMEINEIKIENPNPNLTYVPILSKSKHKIDKIVKDLVTTVEVHLMGSDTIWGKVIDAAKEEPLKNVLVSFKNIDVLTNDDGEYGIKIPAGQILNASERIKLQFSLTNYRTETKSIIMPRRQSSDIIMSKIN
mgnify:CR=1 FL=1